MESVHKDTIDIDKKREELRIFFSDAKFPPEVIERLIENELKPLNEYKNRSYITPSCTDEVKSEYEVMTGQPFTKIDESKLSKLLSPEEINNMLKDSPMITKKAQQIQIIANAQAQSHEVAIPFEAIKIKHIDDINNEKESVKDDNDQINKINYQNMQDLLKSVNDFTAQSRKSEVCTVQEVNENCESTSDEEDYLNIEKIVCQYTDKSYEDRLQQTRNMLCKLADKHEGLVSNVDIKIMTKMYNTEIESYADSDNFRNIHNETKEYTANEVVDDISKCFNKQSNQIYKVCDETKRPNNIENKLQDTQKVLENINTALDIRNNQEHIEYNVKFEENTQENIEYCKDEINLKKMEYQEMRVLAKNIVEDAENIGTIIREDITTKLNNLNELINDVNATLEKSRVRDSTESLTIDEDNIDYSFKSRVTDSQINEIHTTIKNLNLELQHHENRINESRECYEKRNIECKNFITEVDEILLKSREILHPLEIMEENIKKPTEDKDDIIQNREDISDNKKEISNNDTAIENNSQEPVDFDRLYKESMINTKLEEFKQQELERNNRINNLLYDIKDKMRDNEEVLRLANNLLRREEHRKEVLERTTNINPISDINENAKGDHISRRNVLENCQKLDENIPIITIVPPTEGNKSKTNHYHYHHYHHFIIIIT